jgi:hypothetical protein
MVAMAGAFEAHLTDLHRRGKIRSTRGRRKVSKVMREFSKGKLRSGSKQGPTVTNPAQAKAIAMSEGRKAE